MQRLLITILLFFAALASQAQDSTGNTASPLPQRPHIPKPVTHRRQANSIVRKPAVQHILTDSARQQPDTAVSYLRLVQLKAFEHNSYFNFLAKALPAPYQSAGKQQGKEILFYSFMGLLLFFAFLKLTFSKYFSDLTTVFFRTSSKQQQLRQQLLQNPLPSLLFNVLFVLSLSCYLYLLLQKTSLPARFLPWRLFLYTIAMVSITYAIKYLLLKIIGWLAHMQKLSGLYTFLVFMINKMAGILLLPVIMIMAFSTPALSTAALTLSWLMLGGLFMYRFATALQLVKNETSLSMFHFLLYLLAFEIVPVYVIYKLVYVI